MNCQKGPIFANLVLADEINRAPAKVQSALLEAMEERQVRSPARPTKCRISSWCSRPKTRSSRKAPIRLPEAQLDRFLMHVVITYPDEAPRGRDHPAQPRRERARNGRITLRSWRPSRNRRSWSHVVRSTAFSSPTLPRSTSSTLFTRRGFPGRYGEPLSKWIQVGASPRGSLALDRSARTAHGSMNRIS